jgi:RNA polymerase sigma-70 factor (ECF subfamily)
VEPTDEELVARIRAGDRSAADALFGRYAPLLRSLARRGLGERLRPKIAESDVVQDARLVAFRRLDQFQDRGPGSFRRWLAGIVEQRAREERRRYRSAKRAVEREVGAREQAPEPVAACSTPSVAAMSRERREAVLRCIDALPEDYRSVILHVEFSGLTFVQTAEHMDRSADAVRKLYARALARLTQSLAEGGVAGP